MFGDILGVGQVRCEFLPKPDGQDRGFNEEGPEKDGLSCSGGYQLDFQGWGR